MSNQKQLVLVGAGGHASVLLDILNQQKFDVIAYVSPKPAENKKLFCGLKYFQSDDDIRQYSPDEIELVNGIGHTPKNQLRANIYRKFSELGYRFCGVVANSAVISSNAIIAPCAQVLSGAIVQVGSVIGFNSIINTGTIIEHDSIIEANVHMAPKALICGNSKVGQGTFVGAGATIINNIIVGEYCIVAAQTCVSKNIPSHSLARFKHG